VSLLVTVTGRDHPGVTAGLLDVLAEHGADLQDAEQVVVHGRLLLGLVIAGDGDGAQVRAALAAQGTRLGVDVEFTALDDDGEPAARTSRHTVTLLGAPLPPAAFAGVARRLAACAPTSTGVLRLSSWPATSYELLVSGGDTAQLRTQLAAEAVAQQVDVAVEPLTLWRRPGGWW
jgi:phosphoserine phosphatase